MSIEQILVPPNATPGGEAKTLYASASAVLLLCCSAHNAARACRGCGKTGHQAMMPSTAAQYAASALLHAWRLPTENHMKPTHMPAVCCRRRGAAAPHAAAGRPPPHATAWPALQYQARRCLEQRHAPPPCCCRTGRRLALFLQLERVVHADAPPRAPAAAARRRHTRPGAAWSTATRPLYAAARHAA